MGSNHESCLCRGRPWLGIRAKVVHTPAGGPDRQRRVPLQRRETYPCEHSERSGSPRMTGVGDLSLAALGHTAVDTHDVLIFDLDGTLTDPKVGICRSINHALGAYGYPDQPDSVLVGYIGPSLDKTFVSLTGCEDQEVIHGLVAKYRERYGHVGYAENELYPGIRGALAHLAAADVRMGVCTSKRNDFALQVLELFGLASFFEFVEGGDVGIDKTMQLASLVANGRASRRSLMIGDRAIDLAAARANGLYEGGVLWGYGSREEIEAERPTYIFSSCDDWSRFGERS